MAIKSEKRIKLRAVHFMDVDHCFLNRKATAIITSRGKRTRLRIEEEATDDCRSRKYVTMLCGREAQRKVAVELLLSLGDLDKSLAMLREGKSCDKT